MYKIAKVRGVLAAFCDAGFVKVASADAFDDLTEKVAYCLSDRCTIDDVADATSYVIKTAANDKFPLAIPSAVVAGGVHPGGGVGFLASVKDGIRNFGSSAKRYFLKDLGFGDVADNYREYGRLKAVHDGKVADAQRRVGKLVNVDALSPENQQVSKDFHKKMKDRLTSAKLEREKALSGMRGTLGKSLLKSIGKASVPALALYGGVKLLGGLFGNNRPKYQYYH